MPRFQYSLRTLFIVVTMLAIPCGWLGWQFEIIRERERLMRFYSTCSASTDFGRIPVYRHWLGDREYVLIGLHDDTSDVALGLFQSRFPEAVVVRLSDLDEGQAQAYRSIPELRDRWGFGPLIGR